MTVVNSTYEQVASLEDESLRTLLRAGEPIERVWAAWTLGLRLGIQFAKELGAPNRTEPNPGVRRHVAVVLAGAAQRDALVALALGDPDEDVRATAAQLILQTAKEPDVAAAAELLVDIAKNDVGPLVRERVFELLAGRWPRSRLDVALAGLEMPQESLRRAACAVLLSSDLLEQTAGSMLEHALNEPSEHVRRTVLTALTQSGHQAIVIGAVARARREYLTGLLDALDEEDIRLSWGELAPLSRFEDPALDLRLFDLLGDHASADFEFLVSRASRAHAERPPTREGNLAAQVGVIALEALAARIDLPTLSASERRVITQIVADIEAELHELDPGWFGDDEEYEEFKQSLSRQRDRMKRWLK